MNTLRKLLSALLCLALLASVLPLGVQPARAAGEVTLAGDGTPDDPYLIYDADDLIEFAEKVNEINRVDQVAENVDACARLEADIHLEDVENISWTPIGYDDEYPYIGTFDGNEKTISGLSVNLTIEEYTSYDC